jgi:hypothetical protein
MTRDAELMSVAVREVGAEEGHHMRGDIVRCLLWQTVAGLKNKLSPAQWLNGGWPELEAFVEALCGGGMHPALSDWELQKAAGGRPAPSAREMYARRMVVAMCVGLERAGLNKRKARRYAAEQLIHAAVFEAPPSHHTIEHWQRDYGALGRDDELLVATAFATAAGIPDRIAIQFVGLGHLAMNPTARTVGRAQQGWDYPARFGTT